MSGQLRNEVRWSELPSLHNCTGVPMPLRLVITCGRADLYKADGGRFLPKEVEEDWEPAVPPNVRTSHNSRGPDARNSAMPYPSSK